MRPRQVLLLIALATLGVRALTPLGYMPASAGKGLLYELCPEGMPAALLSALSGGGHHHHHGGGDERAVAESCPIGHMLVSAMAADLDVATVPVPEPPVFTVRSPVAGEGRAAYYHRCRSPPA